MSRPLKVLPIEVILRTLRATGSWKAAAEAAGVAPMTLRRACGRDAEFAAECQQAYQVGRDARLALPDAVHETYPLFEDSVVRHGTHSGWTRHSRRKERPCDPCFRAKQDYDRRRLQDPVLLQRGRLKARAQNQAKTALVRRHKAEYDELYRAAFAEIFRDRSDGEVAS